MIAGDGEGPRWVGGDDPKRRGNGVGERGSWRGWWGKKWEGKEVLPMGGIGSRLTREEVATVEAKSAGVEEEAGARPSNGFNPKIDLGEMYRRGRNTF